ncbi:primosomal protein [Bifidobacterium dolichotidis]|uniref:Primosomal protein n=1 Tax=Bifidobacterium dolichotidis TaxID=2306976 RepID=A0A430FPJ6_9BIFI|nr:primosomal protein N' [Bifidobacterium dolichotidis]RSX54753.1 primosomal protein [Bifidobacterium dolichotidis]
MSQLEQPALPGLAPRKRRSRARQRVAAEHLPIARVVLDVQATQLGQLFDYLVEERFAEAAQPGTLVRVRFGGQLVNAVVWERTQTSQTDFTSLRFIERVLSSAVLVPAQMRRDINAIADAFGGTCANIVRVAVAPRVAWVEQRLGPLIQRLSRFEQVHSSDFSDTAVAAASSLGPRVATVRRAITAYEEHREGRFDHMDELMHVLAHPEEAAAEPHEHAYIVDCAPGPFNWAQDIASMVAQAWQAGRSVVVVLPGQRETFDVLHACEQFGLQPFTPDALMQQTPATEQTSELDDAAADEAEADGSTEAQSSIACVGELGDVAMLTGTLSPAQRFASYLAVASGLTRIAIGTRGAMYAPVADDALFIMVDDIAYQNADGFMPYANARGVLRLRAHEHHGVFVCVAMARSALSQYETTADHAVAAGVSGFSEPIHPTEQARALAPRVHWLSREELTKLGDPSIGARVPYTAIEVLRKALETGPVLLSIPHDELTDTLSCATCLRQARCNRCQGPLEAVRNEAPRCRWCGEPASNWQCPECHGTRLRVIRVGAAGTVQQLQGLFPGVPLFVSNAKAPQGALQWVDNVPAIIVATVGSEPMVRGSRLSPGTYAASAVLDAWTSLYKLGIDARIEVLGQWMRVASLTAPASQGGTMFVIGQTDETIAESLEHWDSSLLAAAECEERSQAMLPPAISAATVWGRRDAVRTCLSNIGVLTGDWSVIQSAEGDIPAVLGPVGIAPEQTVNARELENMGDRVKAVVRVSHEHRAELAIRLRQEVARHMARREPGELRFQLDPKDLI